MHLAVNNGKFRKPILQNFFCCAYHDDYRNTDDRQGCRASMRCNAVIIRMGLLILPGKTGSRRADLLKSAIHGHPDREGRRPDKLPECCNGFVFFPVHFSGNTANGELQQSAGSATTCLRWAPAMSFYLLFLVEKGIGEYNEQAMSRSHISSASTRRMTAFFPEGTKGG